MLTGCVRNVDLACEVSVFIVLFFYNDNTENLESIGQDKLELGGIMINDN